MDHKSNKIRGQLALLGGFFVHFVLGSLYLWGSINVYVASYLTYQSQQQISVETMNAVFPFIFQSGGIAVFFTERVMNKFGVQTLCYSTSIFIALFIFLSSYCKILSLFLVTYGVGYGFCQGLIMYAPIYNAYKYFPNKKGLVTGIILSGLGIGNLAWSQIAFLLINPNSEDALPDGYYPQNVANNLPLALRWLSLIYLSLLIAGCLLIRPPQKTENDIVITAPLLKKERLELSKDMTKSFQDEIINNYNNANQNYTNQNNKVNQNNPNQNNTGIITEQISGSVNYSDRKIDQQSFIETTDEQRAIENNQDDLKHNSVMNKKNLYTEEEDEYLDQQYTLKDALKNKLTYIIILNVWTMVLAGMVISNNFKPYGIKNINDDAYLTLLGSLTSVFNAGGRPFFGFCLDKFSFKIIALGNYICQIALICTLSLVANSKIFYMLWVLMLFFFYGGAFAMMVPLTVKLFGQKIGKKLYGFIYQGFCLGAWTQFFIVKYTIPDFGYQNLFYLLGGIIGIGVILSAITTYKLKFQTLSSAPN